MATVLISKNNRQKCRPTWFACVGVYDIDKFGRYLTMNIFACSNQYTLKKHVEQKKK
jgi:hypothetical protein